MFNNIFDHIKLPNKMRNSFLLFAILLINSPAFSQLTHKVNVTAVTLGSPETGMCPGTNQTISVKIRNDGTDTLKFNITNVTISVSITGANPQSYLIVVPSTGRLSTHLEPGGTRTFPITSSANLSNYGQDTYELSATCSGDASPGIDAVENLNVDGYFIDLKSELSTSNQTVCLNSPIKSALAFF